MWDIIFNFFSQHVFPSLGAIGNWTSYYNGEYDEYVTGGTLSDFSFKISESGDGYSYYLGLNDYLSLIATIITMILLLVICCKLIKGIYNSVAHALN